MNDIERNKGVVCEFDELGNRGGDLAQLPRLCTPDIVNHALAPDRRGGIEGTRDFLESARRDMHGAAWIESIVVAERDFVVQFGRRSLEWPRRTFPRVRCAARHRHTRRHVRLPARRRSDSRALGDP